MAPPRSGIRVAVLHDRMRPQAPADEQDNLVQAREVAAALARLGHRVTLVPFARDVGDTVAQLERAGAELVFNLVESIRGEARLHYAAPAFLEILGLPFTGAGTAGLICTSDKPLAKRLLAAAGLPTPELATGAGELAAWPTGARAIVKPACENASIAIDAGSVVQGPARIAAELEARRRRYGGDWFAERFIDGRELNVSLLRGPGGFEVLPIAEIEFVDFPPGRPRIVDYEAKWRPGSFAYTHTPRRFPAGPEDAGLLVEVREIAIACSAVFDLGSYARADLRIDAERRPYVLEVNANPCLSSDAGFYAAAVQAGLDFDAVIARIVAASEPGPRAHENRPRDDARAASRAGPRRPASR